MKIRLYSTPEDIREPLIKDLSRDEDHIEARGYVDSIIKRFSLDPQYEFITKYHKNLSICYATRIRAWRRYKNENDIYREIYVKYSDKLTELTAELIAYYAKKNGRDV